MVWIDTGWHALAEKMPGNYQYSRAATSFAFVIYVKASYRQDSGWHALAEKMPGYGCSCIDEVKCYIGNLDETHEGLIIANSQKAAAQVAGTTIPRRHQ